MGRATGDKRGGLGDRRRPEPQPERLRPGGDVAAAGRDAAELAARPRRAEEEEVRGSGLHHRQPQDLSLDGGDRSGRRFPHWVYHTYRQDRPPPPPPPSATG